VPLSAERAVEQARLLLEIRNGELTQLNTVRRYWKGRQAVPAVIPTSAPHEMKAMSRSSRVNVIPIVLNSLVQSTFVDGFRAGDDGTDLDVWGAWQANRMDARQTAIHRAAFAYGASYAVVLPGSPVPVIRGVSPRAMTCVYGEDPDWPMWGLERLGRGLWRLYDEESIYFLEAKKGGDGDFTFIERRDHGAPGVTPIVRFKDEEDLDDDDEVPSLMPTRDMTAAPTRGQVAPLMSLQDQIDLTTFGLQVAQHYGAFRQRYILGWVAETEREALKASASHVWTFPDAADEDGNPIKVGEFEQTNLEGFIKSREATLRHAATLSQTPVHELIGELVNMSAEALAAAEAGKDRKVDERKTLLGESHEQSLGLAGYYMGVEIPDDAQVVWRDTSARAFAATVDALGKLATMLGIPPQELWERVPGATRQDVDRWKTAAQTGDSFRVLADMLERQAAGAGA
jgi:hypothetical protein